MAWDDEVERLTLEVRERLGDSVPVDAMQHAAKTWNGAKSNNQIAQQIGCDRRYVDRLKAQDGTSPNLDDRVIGKDGKSYPAS